MSITSFIEEFNELTQSNPLNNRESVWEKVVCFEIKVFNNSIRLGNIRAINLGDGSGTEALLWLVALADKHDAAITGTAEPTGRNPRLNKMALKTWYRRHGFEVSGDNIEYTPAGRR